MKTLKMTRKLLIIAINLFFSATFSYAQENVNTCGTGIIPDVEYAKMVADSKLFQQGIASKSVAAEVVPVHFTIVRDVTCSNDRYSIIPKLISKELVIKTEF